MGAPLIQYRRTRERDYLHVYKFVASAPEEEWPIGVRAIGKGRPPHYDRELYVVIHGDHVQKIRDGDVIVTRKGMPPVVGKPEYLLNGYEPTGDAP